MIFHVETTKNFDKQVKKLDRFIQKQILSYLIKNIEGTSNPRQHRKALISNKKGQWRYRVGDYRIIVTIQEDRLVVLALEAGHRKDIYE